MKMLLTQLQRDITERLFIVIVFTFAAIIFGLIPQVYYKYFDSRQYLQIDTVAYNKKVFKPCEEFVQTIHYVSQIDTPVDFRARVYKVVGDNREPVKGTETNIKTFVNKTEDAGVTLVSTGKVPCDFEGVYFQEGVVGYKIKGNDRTAPYRGTLVTVEKEETQE